MTFHHRPLIPSAGGGGASIPADIQRAIDAGFQGAAADYAGALSLAGNGERAEVAPSDGYLLSLERDSGGAVVARSLDLTPLTSAAPLGAGMVVRSGAIASWSGGAVASAVLVGFPVLGVRSYADLSLLAPSARALITGTGIDADMGIVVGVYSPSVDYFLGGGLVGRNNNTQFCYAGLVSGAAAALSWQINVARMHTGNLDGEVVTVTCPMVFAATTIDRPLPVSRSAAIGQQSSLAWPAQTPPAGFLTATDLEIAVAIASNGQPFSVTLQSVEEGTVR